MVISIVIGALGTVCKGLVNELEELEIRDHPNYSIVKIGQYNKKSPGHLRRLAVTPTFVKDHQLTLV